MLIGNHVSSSSNQNNELQNKMNKVFAVGVGPGSPKYVTDIVKEAISQCDVVIGYGYTIKTIEEYVKGKKILEVTMQNQEDAYQKIAKEDNHTILVPFTGDVNFSESEVVDRLIEIYDEVEIIPGISSTQVAASRAKVPTDKSKVITMHISTSIEAVSYTHLTLPTKRIV